MKDFLKQKTTAVRKVVMPVAGLGTRFLPVTKAIPKELLPVGTKPTLQIVIEEALASGTSEIILVTSPHKREIENYFKPNTIYDRLLADHKKEELLHEFRQLTDKISLRSIVQEKPLGLGHAILCAKKEVGNEPFVICLPDVLIESKTPCIKQLLDIYERTGEAVNATEHTPMEKIHLYGVYEIASSEGRLHKASRVVEKPKTKDAPSDLSVVGRYLFNPDIFDILEATAKGYGGEIQLADAMNTLAQKGRLFAYEYEGLQFDTGERLGLLKANIYYGRKEFPDEIGSFIKTLG